MGALTMINTNKKTNDDRDFDTNVWDGNVGLAITFGISRLPKILIFWHENLSKRNESQISSDLWVFSD